MIFQKKETTHSIQKPYRFLLALLCVVGVVGCTCKPNQVPKPRTQKNKDITDAMIEKAKTMWHGAFLADYLQKLQDGKPVDVNARESTQEGLTVLMIAANGGDVPIL